MNASNQSSNHQFDSQDSASGQSLVHSGGFFMRLINPILSHMGAKFLRKMDAGLEIGTVEGHLPNGDIRILGARQPGPYVKVDLNSWYALIRVGRDGSIGLFESWRRGEWASEHPEIIFELFTRNRKAMGDTARASGFSRHMAKILHIFRRNSKNGSRRNIEFHYDLGNDFYKLWLDENMNYSSADFSGLDVHWDVLGQAQNQKIDRLLDRLALQDGQSLLEVGCGWGAFALRALDQSLISYHGITLSHEQKSLCDELLSKRPQIAARSHVTITDYREISGQYDAIASVEMVEAVGEQYWPDYLDMIAQHLKPQGRAAIQYIRIEDDVFEAYRNSADFIQHYIFPGGMLISESRFKALAAARGLLWTDQYDFGLDYADTLKLWRMKFEQIVDQGLLPKQFDEKFVQMWRFYLLYCEGGFRGGAINVSQVTLLKE